MAGERTRLVLSALRQMNEAVLERPSDLPGWSRLTIVCHLRYGTKALLRMTLDALTGRETAHYPLGRARQRPKTLVLSPNEKPADLLDDWQSAAEELDAEWSRLDDDQWATDVVEPAANPDLGTIPLARLALARLTEVDVHGTDLNIGVPDWSQELVEVGLPTRLRWLSTRRTNHREFDRLIRGSWLLKATDGPRWFVAVDGDRVQSRLATDHDTATADIEGTSRDLLALLLGRPPRQPLQLIGDVAFAEAFERAFPGP